jgi:chromosome segregation ATPase
MSEPLNFRSAFNGFNREDVVHYIEYLNANHANQIRQLQADLATMQRESFLPEVDEDQAARIAEMEEQFAQQESLLTALNAEKDELLAKCAQLEAQLAAVNAAKETARPQFSACMEEELAAYRRAERVERLANERANAIYRDLRVSLQGTADKTESAVTKLDSISSQFNAQINALRDSLFDNKSYLDQSLASLNDLKVIEE